MSSRTTLILDDDAKRAASELASRYGCSVSEAIRRAIVRHRDAALGVPVESRRERKLVLRRLVELFDGNDAAEEVTRLKSQDEGF